MNINKLNSAVSNEILDLLTRTYPNAKKLLDKYKILFTARKNKFGDMEVQGKVVELITLKRKPRRVLDREDKLKIKEAKKLLKDKTDAIYLYVLLVRATEELKKVSRDKLPISSLGLFSDVARNLDQLLNIKMLEVKQ